MIEEDRHCIDILQQIASLRSAANSLALILLRGHLELCFAEALQAGSQGEKLDEVIEAVRRYSRN
jgi:DNA-binding FrmR family transcriptional regulator